MNYYYDNEISINRLLDIKFNKLYKTNYNAFSKPYNNYQLIKLSLFIKKIYNYEPGLVILIGYIHDINYQSIITIPKDIRRPLRRNACIGLINEYKFDNGFYCICNSCDPFGTYLLRPYRISKQLLKKINKNY